MLVLPLSLAHTTASTRHSLSADLFLSLTDSAMPGLSSIISTLMLLLNVESWSGLLCDHFGVLTAFFNLSFVSWFFVVVSQKYMPCGTVHFPGVCLVSMHLHSLVFILRIRVVLHFSDSPRPHHGRHAKTF